MNNLTWRRKLTGVKKLHWIDVTWSCVMIKYKYIKFVIFIERLEYE